MKNKVDSLLQPLLESVYFFKSSIATLITYSLIIHIPIIVIGLTSFLSAEENSANIVQNILVLIYKPYMIGLKILLVHAISSNKKFKILSNAAHITRHWQTLFLTYIATIACVLLGILFFILPGIYIGLRLCFIMYIAVLEKPEILSSFKRSIFLSEGKELALLSNLFFPACLYALYLYGFGVFSENQSNTLSIEQFLVLHAGSMLFDTFFIILLYRLFQYSISTGETKQTN